MLGSLWACFIERPCNTLPRRKLHAQNVGPRSRLPYPVICSRSQIVNKTFPSCISTQTGVSHLDSRVRPGNAATKSVTMHAETHVRPRHRRLKHGAEDLLPTQTLKQSSFDNDPSAGSPTETLLRLLLPLNDTVWSSSRNPS